MILQSDNIIKQHLYIFIYSTTYCTSTHSTASFLNRNYLSFLWTNIPRMRTSFFSFMKDRNYFQRTRQAQVHIFQPTSTDNENVILKVSSSPAEGYLLPPTLECTLDANTSVSVWEDEERFPKTGGGQGVWGAGRAHKSTQRPGPRQGSSVPPRESFRKFRDPDGGVDHPQNLTVPHILKI